MRRVVLDGKLMQSRKALHDYLARILELPSYYGANLDALHDVLTELSEDTELVVTDSLEMQEALGTYGDTLIRVLQDSAEENPFLRIILI